MTHLAVLFLCSGAWALDTLLLVESVNYNRDSTVSTLSAFTWQLHADGSKVSTKRIQSEGKWQEGHLISRYDASGNLISESRYTAPDRLHMSRTRTFDSLGRLVLDSLSYDFTSYVRIETFAYEYAGANLSRLAIRRPWFEGDMTFDYAYDAGGRLVRHLESDSLGRLQFTNDYEYGPGSDSSRTIRINSADDTIMVFSYRYGSGGRILRKTEAQPVSRGGVIWITDYQYDAFGNKVREEVRSDQVTHLNPVTTWVYRSLDLVPVGVRNRPRNPARTGLRLRSAGRNLLGRSGPGAIVVF